MRTEVLFPFLLAALARALDNGVGLTPAMGWNSWNRFRCEGLHETLIIEVAEAMVSSGLRDAGYVYVNIDDCWQETRGADGHIIPFKSRFPSGMKAVGDKIHALGLKFGIYSCAGKTTCEGWPGSYGHETVDANDYASWGVDYLKYDFCGFEKVEEKKSPEHYYTLMRDALNATGRPILYSMCNWGVGSPHLWGHRVGNSWRTGRDVFAVWDEHECRQEMKLPSFLQSIETAIEQQAGAAYIEGAGPGGFNDPDMLVVGLDGMTPYGIVDECPPHLPAGTCKKGDYVSREVWGVVGGLTHTEQKAVFSFWCMLAAPLMLGNDPRTMSAATKRILTAPQLLRISQDKLGKQASRVFQSGVGEKLSVWVKPLDDGTYAVLLFNGGARPADVTVRWSRDLADAAKPWLRETERMPPCADKPEVKQCGEWTKSGECTKNAGFMRANCRRSCDACPPAIYDGPQATALVRDAWEEEDLGTHVALYTARHVEAHEARVLIVKFGEPSKLEAELKAHRRPAAQRGHEIREIRKRAEEPPGAFTPGAFTLGAAAVTLQGCASEHMDSLLLLVLAIVVASCMLLVGLQKLVQGEMGRSQSKVGKTTPAKGQHAL